VSPWGAAKVSTVASTDEGVNVSGRAVDGAVGVRVCVPLADDGTSVIATPFWASVGEPASSRSYGSVAIT